MLPLHDNVPTRGFPVVTVGLITANAAVWFWEFSGTSVEVDLFRYGFYPCKVAGPCYLPGLPGLHAAELPWWQSVFTSMFMHASLAHILGNILFLWIFGNNVEDALGRARFLLWYLAAGVVAASLQTFVTLWFGTAADASIPNIGASGAISGVLGAYVVLLPRAKVLTLVGWFPLQLPALLYIGFWFALQLWAGSSSVVNPQSGGGVAFFAHVGGFLFGVVTVRLVASGRPYAPSTDARP